MSSPVRHYVGVIADGPTDKVILAELVKQLLSSNSHSEDEIESVRLQQEAVPFMDRFRADYFGTKGSRSLCSPHARELRCGLVGLLFKVVQELENHIARPVCEKDIIVLNTDAERYLRDGDAYLADEWALALSHIFWAATEDFYHKTEQRYLAAEHIPTVVPLVLFPSTDIVVAAARAWNQQAFTSRDKKAPDLKKELYGVTDLRYLDEDGLKSKALDHLNADGCAGIMRHVPEARLSVKHLRCFRTR
jgi:hypothetical protein